MSLPVKTWREHCAEIDGSKGITNKMIQECMLAEIKDLRRALSASEISKLRNARDRWKSHAQAYWRALCSK